MKFKEFKELQEQTDVILAFMYVLDNPSLNESILTESDEQITEGINDWLGKAGLKLHKGKGLIDYVKNFSTGAGKLIIAAFKQDKEEVKRIADTFKKEEVVDFLLKLDMATMHLVTGPIHFVDAVTGWDLMANISAVAKKAEKGINVFKKAIKTVKDSVLNILDGSKQARVIKVVQKIEDIVPKYSV